MPAAELVKIRTSPNWYIQWWDAEAGRNFRNSTRTADRGEAEAIKRAWELEQDSGPRETTTVTEVLDWYWETHAQHTKRPDYADLARKPLKAFFGATLASACGVAKQQAYMDERRRKGHGISTIRRDLLVLSAALRRAAKHERIEKAPAMLTVPTLLPKERWLTRDEVARLFAKLHASKRRRHLLLFARLALWTGQRSGAILGLTWDRVLFDYGLINFKRPTDAANKKAVLSPLPPNLRRALLRTKAKAKTEFVIEYAGEAPERVVRGFKRACVELGYGDVSPHTLRHSFATWATLKGLPLFDTGQALGQSIQATTARYAHAQTAGISAVQNAVRRK